MSNLIVILGESGTGKSTSIRNLNPKETFIINVLSKPLPMRGYKKKYNAENKNFLESDNYKDILNYLKAINDRRDDIKTIIIDDFSFLMNNEFMRRCRERGFDKFTEMGVNMFEILEACKRFRPDLMCYIMCHTERDHAGIIKPKTVGKMTSDYVGIAERVSIVLHSQIIDGQYKFLTQNDGICVAKSPMDMFSELYIDNDLNMIRDAIDNYFNEEE
jgi:nicotinamide riboside kinase